MKSFITKAVFCVAIFLGFASSAYAAETCTWNSSASFIESGCEPDISWVWIIAGSNNGAQYIPQSGTCSSAGTTRFTIFYFENVNSCSWEQSYSSFEQTCDCVTTTPPVTPPVTPPITPPVVVPPTPGIAQLESVSVTIEKLDIVWNTSVDIVRDRNLSISETIFNTGPVIITRNADLVDFDVVTDGTYAITVSGIEQYTQKLASETFVAYRDTTPPVVTDIDITTWNPENLSADNAYEYNISVSTSWGSAIVSIAWTKENSANQSSTAFNDTTPGSFNQSWNISEVDNFRNANPATGDITARDYSFTITDACDQAENCGSAGVGWSVLSRTHHVYANSDSAELTVAGWSNNLNSGAIAQGTNSTLNLVLEDEYDNAILPSTSIGREIEFIVDANNELALNQYDYEKNLSPNASAVFVNTIALPLSYGLWSNATSLGNLANSADQYELDFQVYSPTSNSLGNEITEKNRGSFSLDTIHTNISGLGNESTSLDTDIDFVFTPLFTTSFEEDKGIKEFGLRIDGGIQESKLNFSERASGSAAIDRRIYFRYGTSDTLNSAILDKLEMQFSSVGDFTTATEEPELDIASSMDPSSMSTSDDINFRTILTSSDTIAQANSTYLSTHIWYSIDGLDVVYNGEYIGSDDTLEFNTVNSGLRVEWKIHSQQQRDITTEQAGTLISFGNISKSILRESMSKNVYEIVKNLPDMPQNAPVVDLTVTNLASTDWEWNSSSGSIAGAKKNILYFGWLSGRNVVIDNGVETNEVSGNKTIVAVGWNIYIKDSLYYQGSDDMLWLIAIKDANGNGWNVYIDTQITNIVGSIYAQWSLISYDGVNEISEDVTQEELKNQLHILGSVFSENTIWGSVKETIPWSGEYICPFNVDEFCSKSVAQRYDLNYLRRYQLYTVDLDEDETTLNDNFKIPVNDAKVIGNSTCNYNTTTLEYDCSTSPSFSGYQVRNIYSQQYYLDNTAIELASIHRKYPVIIQYNPQISLTPPPLFSE